MKLHRSQVLQLRTVQINQASSKAVLVAVPAHSAQEPVYCCHQIISTNTILSFIYHTIPYHTKCCPHSLSEPHIQGISAGYCIPQQRNIYQTMNKRTFCTSSNKHSTRLNFLGLSKGVPTVPSQRHTSPVEDYRSISKEWESETHTNTSPSKI